MSGGYRFKVYWLYLTKDIRAVTGIAFLGDIAEILNNRLYQDQRIELSGVEVFTFS